MSIELMAESAIERRGPGAAAGGRALVCVDSLVLGMAILAEQNYWAHLRQTGEVMLVPWPDGSITRCFSSAQLRELLTGAGLEVEWMRPRTVLSPSTVDHVLAADARALDLAGAHRAGGPAGRRRHGGHPPGRQRPQDRCDRGGRGLSAGARACDWHCTQRAASGRASSRPSGTGLPQSTQWP